LARSASNPQEGLRDPWQTALELQAYTGGGEADTILTRFGHGGVTGLGVGNLQITAQKHANAVAEPAFRALSFRGCGRAWRAIRLSPIENGGITLPDWGGKRYWLIGGW